MKPAIKITYTKCRLGQPLAIVDSLPGEGAELRPADMRALAKILLEAARTCEERVTAKPYDVLASYYPWTRKT
ncbi:MAG: hypothetical protein V4621_07690 [Pseudomonadota bacterium]